MGTTRQQLRLRLRLQRCGDGDYGRDSFAPGADTTGTATNPSVIPAQVQGVQPGVDVGRPGYNPGGLGGPASGLGVRPGAGVGGLGPRR